MKRAIIRLFTITWTLALPSLQAQEPPEEDGLVGAMVETDASQQDQALRQQFLKLLKTEVEPNLPAADVKTLNQSVQRLGSYREEWALKAEAFLVANAPVAELYLYRYSMLKNPRLNIRILKTLRQFPNFRFPKATLAFADLFSEQKVEFLEIIAAAVRQDPSMGFDAFQFVMNTWGTDLSVQNKIYFLSQTCPAWKKASPPLPDMIGAVLSQASSFWDQVFAEEVRSCLKGY